VEAAGPVPHPGCGIIEANMSLAKNARRGRWRPAEGSAASSLPASKQADGKQQGPPALAGRRLVDRAIDLLEPHVEETFVVGPPESFQPFMCPFDPTKSGRPDRSVAFLTGLRHARFDRSLVLGVDLALPHRGGSGAHSPGLRRPMS